MEHSIGVGGLVGLIIASSLYVWNSDEFTKEQKTFLLIAMVFAPVQWIGILVIKYYNNHQFENTPERKTEKKLDSTISNLTELKEKGILTAAEYNVKAQKVRTEKTEQNLKSSIEYRQLKSLFDSGILSKNEFENKIHLLQNVLGYVPDSYNKTSIESTKEKEKTTQFAAIYVIIGIFLLVGAIIFYSNSSTNNSENIYIPPAIDTTAYYNTKTNRLDYQKSLFQNKKFVYIIMKIKKPKLDVYQPMSYTNTLGFDVTPEPTYSIIFENETYSTEIIDIENYNIDEKYKAMDNAKNKMYSKLAIDDSVYSSNLWVKCKDDAKREEFQKISSEIVDTQIYEFDSYSEASRDKESKDLQ